MEWAERFHDEGLKRSWMQFANSNFLFVSFRMLNSAQFCSIFEGKYDDSSDQGDFECGPVNYRMTPLQHHEEAN